MPSATVSRCACNLRLCFTGMIVWTTATFLSCNHAVGVVGPCLTSQDEISNRLGCCGEGCSNGLKFVLCVELI